MTITYVETIFTHKFINGQKEVNPKQEKYQQGVG